MTSPLKTYEFEWGVDGMIYDDREPVLRVRARNVRSAKTKARVKLTALLRYEGRAHWRWSTETREWFRVPSHEVKGSLASEPVIVQRRKKPRPIQYTEAEAEAREAFYRHVGPPILAVIEKAPPFESLFVGMSKRASGPLWSISYSRAKPVKAPPYSS